MDDRELRTITANLQVDAGHTERKVATCDSVSHLSYECLLFSMTGDFLFYLFHDENHECLMTA